MPYQVDVVEATPTLLAAVRKQTTFESLDVVYTFLKTAPVRQRGQNVIVYLDDLPTVEVGVQVSSEFRPTDSVVCSSTPGGLSARTVHIGPYATLPKAPCRGTSLVCGERQGARGSQLGGIR